ncbi:D-sedoheptulose-7-phosphate isomerase [Sphingomonas crocodyli]|uniref:Phosphoheptose isomerase n=1 Tax=Sphingomonas crocodyli TaxID=1979270 RepID=A0A437MBC3_9SPHN|nr:D-sedoheptulose 7-phosphate isomerase [Sphingomonas crocodyli]RVT94940.1 SIS domain-containing protein [Sphingomonas crocodyli]
MLDFISQELNKTSAVVIAMKNDFELSEKIEKAARIVTSALRNGKKILLAGNGGSAADSQHIAGEFVSRFYYDRPGLPAIALTVDTSVLTAIGNDYGYERVFSRQVEALGCQGDIFWGYSTSGRSPNILAAMKAAQGKGMTVIGMTGSKGWSDPSLCELTLAMPSTETPKIQEGHLIVGHIICGLVEKEIFPRSAE